MPAAARPAPGPLSQELSAILRERIARLRVAQIHVAHDAGMSTSQLSDFLAGKKTIDIERVEAICLALDLNFLETIKRAEAASSRRKLEG